jgi:predicted RNA binding protein YcfA (HicA-like mRNA interferase family)
MKSLSGKALCRVVERHGWQLKRITSSHHIYTKAGRRMPLSIPVHGNRDLPVGTLRGLLKDAGLTEDDLDI